MKLKGIVVPIGTPLDEDEQVDKGGLQKLTRTLVEAGVHGIMVNGSMGGFAHLGDREQMVALEVVLNEVGGRIPVVANVGENGTRRAIRKAREFESLNPDYLAFLPPFYFLMTQRDLKDFYQEAANGVQTQAFIYNNPATTKSDLDLETIFKLSEHPNIIGIKDSKQDFDKWLKMVRFFRNHDFSVLVGTESLACAALALGCDGVIGGLHNICPQLAVRLYESIRVGDLPTAEACQHKLNNLFSIFQNGNIWGAFEVALQHLQICRKVTVSPFRSVRDDAERQQIIQILEKNLSLPISAVSGEGTC